MFTPSGEQIEIEFEEQRAVIVEVGGGLRTYSVGDRELLDGYRADELCTSGRGQILLPWPNRLQDGHYEFDGRSHQLPLTEPENGNAIHGLVSWAAWTVAEREPQRVVMEHLLHPQPGYPFSLALRVEYLLSIEGLRVRTTATNAGPERCPFGSGMHPYLTLGTATIDALTLQAPGRTILWSDERGLPAGTASVADTEFDFRQPRPISGTVLDNAFTELERDSDGLACVRLWESAGEALTVWVDESYPYLQLFSGDPLPDVARRAIAVEPMTCPPNAFRSGESLVSLDPGGTFTSMWGITPSLGASH